MGKQIIIIEVSAHSNCGRHIGDEMVKGVKWQFEKKGGKFNFKYLYIKII